MAGRDVPPRRDVLPITPCVWDNHQFPCKEAPILLYNAVLHTFNIDPERELIVARYIGRTTVQDMKDLALIIWADPDYSQNFDGIIDYRDSELNASPDAISEIADFFLHASEASYGRAAIVAARPLETALNFLFAERMQRRNVLRVFTTWEAACRFVERLDARDPRELSLPSNGMES